MTIEPFIALFFTWYIRKHFSVFFPEATDKKIMNWILVGMVALFFLHVSLPIIKVTNWFWHLLVFGTAYLVYTRPLMERMRTKVIAILPLVTIFLIEDIIRIFFTKKEYSPLEDYVDFAIVFAFAWMIAMLIRSNKQNKALEKEQEKTRLEAERNKFISAQKDKLEIIVEERTAELTKQKDELMHALSELKSTQALLIQSEKMASLGELTAGIAHEIKNPLNFVSNFSELNAELVSELKEELNNGNLGEAKAIADIIINNEEKLLFHSKKADAIVKGMLQHSRTSSGVKQLTDINALSDECLQHSHHSIQSIDKSFAAELKTDFDYDIGEIDIIPQEIGRVLSNLLSNSFYAVNEKKKETVEAYVPTVSLCTKKEGEHVLISVKDNGKGIPLNVIDKIFQPFFTTKPTGEGTGLGLSLAYDIVKAHGGELKVDTQEGEGSEFIVQLPMESRIS